MAPTDVFPYFIRPTELTADNGAFYAMKEWYMASLDQPIHACAKDLYCTLWAYDQAVCIDVTPHGTFCRP
jgi:hypothetical protein